LNQVIQKEKMSERVVSNECKEDNTEDNVDIEVNFCENVHLIY